MRQNKLALFSNKFFSLYSLFRKFRYKCLGLSIGPGSSIGRLGFEWGASVSIGQSCTIENGVDFKVDYPFSNENYIIIGNRNFIGRATEFHSSTKILIGDDCLIASQCIFAGVGHEYSKDALIIDQPVTTGDILLEDDVWIGTGSKILQGVVIGRGSIVGAGSVVNKSIPANEIWAGIPAKFIKHRE